MKLIDRDELKAKIDAGGDFKLVMVLSEWAYRAKHIPGSLNIDHPTKAIELLDPSDEIIVYSSDANDPQYGWGAVAGDDGTCPSFMRPG